VGRTDRVSPRARKVRTFCVDCLARESKAPSLTLPGAATDLLYGKSSLLM